MPLTSKHFAILLLIILCGFGLRTHKSLQFENLEHDDQISLLVASAHLGDYAQFTAANANSPAIYTAAQWQQFLQPKSDATLIENTKQISQDLQQYDIHPPLYFFWLHQVMQIVPEISPRIGWIANAGFLVLNGFLLFALSLQILRNATPALLATLIWSMSSAAILGSIVARHYEILTFFTLLSTIILWPSLAREKISPLPLVVYGIVLALGFLANYQFLYHIAALSLIILLSHFQRPTTVIIYGVVTVAAVAIALYWYPALLNQTREVSHWNANIATADILFRMRNTLEEIAKYCIAGSLLLLILLIKQRDGLTRIDKRLWILMSVNLLALAGAYLAFVSPRHAMGGRYMASVGPLLSMLFATASMAIWQNKPYRYALLGMIILPALLLAKKPTKTAAIPTLALNASLVIADFDSRGVLPGIALQLKPQQQMLVASQDYLLTHSEWLGQIPSQGAVWISDRNAQGNSTSKQTQLQDLLTQHMQTQPVKTKDRGLRYLVLTPASTQPR